MPYYFKGQSNNYRGDLKTKRAKNTNLCLVIKQLIIKVNGVTFIVSKVEKSTYDLFFGSLPRYFWPLAEEILYETKLFGLNVLKHFTPLYLISAEIIEVKLCNKQTESQIFDTVYEGKCFFLMKFSTSPLTLLVGDNLSNSNEW